MKLNFNEICRLCLLKEGDMSSIFSVPLPTRIMSFVSFEVSMNKCIYVCFLCTKRTVFLMSSSWYFMSVRLCTDCLFCCKYNIHFLFVYITFRCHINNQIGVARSRSLLTSLISLVIN
jgi:hypothetical protein